MPKARAHIRKGIIKEMMQKCNYICPICHRIFFFTYKKFLLCPECYLHKDDFSVDALNRRDKKKRRNFCVGCNKPLISIHHIDGNPLNNEMDNLVPLCRSCHIEYDMKIESKEGQDKIKKLRNEWYDYCKHILDF